MTFDQILPHLKAGKEIKRSGPAWDVMSLFVTDWHGIKRIMVRNDRIIVPWPARDYDILAEDWQLAEDK